MTLLESMAAFNYLCVCVCVCVCVCIVVDSCVPFMLAVVESQVAFGGPFLHKFYCISIEVVMIIFIHGGSIKAYFPGLISVSCCLFQIPWVSHSSLQHRSVLPGLRETARSSTEHIPRK